MRVDFYHLTFTSAAKTLPRLLEKPYRAGLRVLALARNEDEKALFDKEFWSYTTKFFLPHGTDDGMKPERQPVLIAAAVTDVNAPKAIACAGADIDLDALPEGCDRVLYMFDGTDEADLKNARAFWKRCEGVERHYFQQQKNAGWTEKQL